MRIAFLAVCLLATTPGTACTSDRRSLQARREHDITCVYQPGHYACQGGLGYEKPVTSFTVRDGRVVSVQMAAVAD